jgi:hypothetical protein
MWIERKYSDWDVGKGRKTRKGLYRLKDGRQNMEISRKWPCRKWSNSDWKMIRPRSEQNNIQVRKWYSGWRACERQRHS